MAQQAPGSFELESLLTTEHFIQLPDLKAGQHIDMCWSEACQIKWARTADPNTWKAFGGPYTQAGYLVRPLCPPPWATGIGISTGPAPGPGIPANTIQIWVVKNG